MNRLRNWLRSWLGIYRVDTLYQQLVDGVITLPQIPAQEARIAEIEANPKPDILARERADMALARIGELEKELSKQEQAHSAEIAELRERLDMPAKRKPSGRPFSVLQKVAAMGAEAQRIKDAG